MTLVGITGTNGKTTVAYMVEAIALAAGRRTGRIGTVGLAIGGERHASERTTPEAPDFYRLLAEMREQEIELVATEVSSHALALSRVEGARFTTAAFLNLGRDHLDFHKDEKAYFEAKAKLFEGLGREQHAVLPADSPHGAELRRRTRGKVWTFGRSESADVRLEQERCAIDGSSAVLETPSGALPFSCRLAGRFNLDNAAAAAACALAAGLSQHAIPRGLGSLQRVPGRMERIDRGQPFAVIVDYAHTADALGSLLSWLRGMSAGRVLVVFGCGGERDRGKRFLMGQAAATHAQRIFLKGLGKYELEATGRQVVLTAEWINELSIREAECHGVDGKVATPEIVFDGQIGIIMHLKVAVTGTGGMLGTRQRDVHCDLSAVLLEGEFDHRKGPPHPVRVTIGLKQAYQIGHVHTAHKIVGVQWLQAQQAIAHGASHLKQLALAPDGVLHDVRQARNHGTILVPAVPLTASAAFRIEVIITSRPPPLIKSMAASILGPMLPLGN